MSVTIAWIWLFFAAIFEVTWAVGIKFTEGFTRLYPSVFVIMISLLSFYCLAQSVRVLPIGTAYAVWTGMGAVCTVVIGMLFLGEPSNLLRIVCIGLIIAGIVGLKVSAA